jgi:hypothetical protein
MNQEYLKQVLDYDPETGDFFWKHRPNSSDWWNKRFVGKKAGCVERKIGYVQIPIYEKTYRGHRLAWLYMTGEWPTHEVDHIDLCKSNNAWANLREATPSQNQCNHGKRGDNTSGFKGVTFNKTCRKPWQAQIMFGRKYKYLGCFNTPEEAHAVYCEAAATLHKEFARTL